MIDWLVQYILPNLWVVLIPFVVKLLLAEIAKVQNERVRLFLIELVRAAEQTFTPGTGIAKKAFVEEQAANAGVRVRDTALEAAVHEVTAPCPGVRAGKGNRMGTTTWSVAGMVEMWGAEERFAGLEVNARMVRNGLRAAHERCVPGPRGRYSQQACEAVGVYLDRKLRGN